MRDGGDTTARGVPPSCAGRGDSPERARQEEPTAEQGRIPSLQEASRDTIFRTSVCPLPSAGRKCWPASSCGRRKTLSSTAAWGPGRHTWRSPLGSARARWGSLVPLSTVTELVLKLSELLHRMVPLSALCAISSNLTFRPG